MVKIVQKEDPVLRQVAQEVPVDEIITPKIQKIIADMKKALASQDDGVAIAAPQIGVPLRIFVMSGKAVDIAKKTTGNIDEVYINPIITKISKDRKMVDEGCLSVRYLYGKMKRATRATVEAYNEKGEKFSRGASGLIAQIFQHETDHLDGILFIDNAKSIRDVPPKGNE
ncbi:MAG: peptide deformylase [bacterium]